MISTVLEGLGKLCVPDRAIRSRNAAMCPSGVRRPTTYFVIILEALWGN